MRVHSKVRHKELGFAEACMTTVAAEAKWDFVHAEKLTASSKTTSYYPIALCSLG